jgi:hypothetical protein
MIKWTRELLRSITARLHAPQPPKPVNAITVYGMSTFAPDIKPLNLQTAHIAAIVALEQDNKQREAGLHSCIYYVWPGGREIYFTPSHPQDLARSLAATTSAHKMVAAELLSPQAPFVRPQQADKLSALLFHGHFEAVPYQPDRTNVVQFAPDIVPVVSRIVVKVGNWNVPFGSLQPVEHFMEQPTVPPVERTRSTHRSEHDRTPR